MFLRKGVLKICSKFTGGHSCRSVISIKLQSNFIEIILCHGCSPANLLHVFRTPFPKNTSGRLLLPIDIFKFICLFPGVICCKSHPHPPIPAIFKYGRTIWLSIQIWMVIANIPFADVTITILTANSSKTFMCLCKSFHHLTISPLVKKST